MPNYHTCQVIGHLGKDPEIRFTQSGEAVANFSVAYTEKWNDKEQTTWFRVTAWKKLAEVAQKFLKKGDAVMIVGRMQCRKYQDKTGNEREAWELTADVLKLMGARSQPKEATEKKPAAAGGFADMEDDIPFLFNMNTVCDIIGTPNSLWRSQRGKNGKEMLLLRSNKID